MAANMGFAVNICGTDLAFSGQVCSSRSIADVAFGRLSKYGDGIHCPRVIILVQDIKIISLRSEGEYADRHAGERCVQVMRQESVGRVAEQSAYRNCLHAFLHTSANSKRFKLFPIPLSEEYRTLLLVVLSAIIKFLPTKIVLLFGLYCR